ncbi:MAG TPA: exodeoxyribonuclease III [Bacteroidales bacterium]|nr:exodeoxyribonuclease III [Bacteroidales bacterium]
MERLRILSWNVNGIRSQIGKDFYNTVRNLNPDILCLQETKAQYENMPDLTKELPAYEMYLNAAVQKGYAGTAVLSKVKPLYQTKDIGMEKHDQEGRVINLEFESFYLVNVYVPNSGQELKRLDYRKEWDEEFLNHIKKLDTKKPVIVIGDLNVAHEPIDLARPKENYNKVAGYTQVEIDGFKKLTEAGFVDTFRHLYKDKVQYTYWSQRFNARAKNVGWRIDYFIVSKRFVSNVKDSFILDQVMGSDHCPLGIDIEV